MARLLAFGFDYGHIYPTLPVLEALVGLGHEVVYYVPPRFAETVRRTGVTPASLSVPRAEALPLPLQVAEQTASVMPAIGSDVRAAKATAILYDAFCVPARLLAEKFGIPQIALHSTYPLPAFQGDGTLAHEFQARMAPIFSAHGVTPFEMREIFTSPATLQIVYMARDFHPRGDDFDKRYCFVGASLPVSEPGEHLPPETLRRRPLAYVTLGTVFNTSLAFFRDSILAFTESEWRVILSLGGGLDPSLFRGVPDNVTVTEFVPQSEVLRNADLLVSSGGMGTVQGALYHGVPSVLAPLIPDHGTTAQRVEQLGAGVCVDPGALSPSLLREAIDHVYGQTSFRESARALGEESRRAGGAKHAAEIIHRYVTRE